MKHVARALALLLVLCLMPVFSLADFYSYGNTTGGYVYAYSNQRIATRSGPSTNYLSTGSYYQAGYGVKVYSAAWDDRNGIWWVQIELDYQGQPYRLYTGIKRIDVDVNSLYQEVNGGIASGHFSKDYIPKYGPGTNYADYSFTVKKGQSATVILFENGYALVEFQNKALDGDNLVRVWVPEKAFTLDSQSGGGKPYTGGTSLAGEIPVSYVTASDYISSAKWNWGPGNVADNNPETCWQVKGTGEMFIELHFKGAHTINQFSIRNGYQYISSGVDQYFRNARPGLITLEAHTGGSWEYLGSFSIPEINPRPSWYTITVPTTFNVDAVRMTVDTYQAGDSYEDDVCVSDIMVFGN